ncbi:acetyl-CoA synthetase-like protein [Aspergillus fijiensis CBS 313.89]|uniref:Acetyl-CoA synthetase-like protein n=1 Tax=Aspergillus fijiensis CBS 313.89 TaxID=1448319 RepID=A0A8G1RPE0_9EURO|nr:acetyl-CoA synthetase-like protein [Aspergillus fijiensis CBS 313.89]RAK76333.1 acetyl-CoA synthetase-like protein [Aspergillus fijiensis CBS 313.89]
MAQPSSLTGPPPLLANPFPSLDQQFRQNVREHPDTLALVCPHQPASLYTVQDEASSTTPQKPTAEGLRWTYAQLDEKIERFATNLRRRGVGRGSLMVLFATNTAEYVVATWAAYRIGCVHVPLSPRCLGHEREAVHMLETAVGACQPDSVVVVAAAAAAGLERVAGLVRGLQLQVECCLVAISGGEVGVRDGWVGFEELMHVTNPGGKDVQLAEEERDEDEDEDRRSDVSQLSDDGSRLSDDSLEQPHRQQQESSIFFTSGTTSLPKGCFVQASAFPTTVARAWRSSPNRPMLPGDRVAVVLPNNHAFGYMFLMAAFLNAATIVFPGEAFAPERLIETIRQERCTHTALVPTMLHALSGVAVAPAQKLHSLKRVVLAGAPPTEEVLRICLSHLGAQAVENFYGMTEGIVVSTDAAESVDKVISGRDVSIGRPLPGAKVRICAKGSRVPVALGAVGEVHFSGPSLIDGYIGNRDDEKFYTGEDGRRWFCTGDKAVVGQDGRLYLVGRYNDTIIRGGENIEPSAIEAVLGQTAEFHVLEPQIVRAPDQVAGEVPVAVVRTDVDEQLARQLQDTVRTKMGALFVPAGVVPVSALGLDDYPRTLAGKVQKSKLTELVEVHWTAQKSQGRSRLYSRAMLESRLKHAWAQASGLNDAMMMDVNVNLAAYADVRLLESIKSQIWKDMASSVTLSDWLAADTVAEEMEAIESGGQETLESHPNSQLIESLLAAIVSAKGENIDPTMRMIDLGIDSITSIALLNQIRQETGVSLPSSLFFTPHTIGGLIERLQSSTDPSSLLEIDSATQETPRECFSTLIQGTPKPGVPCLFMTPPGSGYAFSYEPLPKFANDLAVYALGSPFLMSKSDATWTVEEAAALYVKTIRKLQPEGPYLLGGWSMGAILAYEEAYQLRQQGQQVLGIINLDMPLPRPDPHVLEPTVKLLEIVGFYPAIRRAGKPDMEIPSYRREHSLASVRAKLKYSPRPMRTASEDSTPVRIFVIWAGHGDPDRLPAVLVEADEILRRCGPETQARTSQEWLQTPRESMGPVGWAEMVGEENVECHVIDHAHHDTLMDPEVVEYTARLMQVAVDKWLSSS